MLDVQVGDGVRLRKPHACGGDRWQVVRVGADIGLTCDRCGRRVMLERRDLERRMVGQPVRRAGADGGAKGGADEGAEAGPG